MPQKSIQQWEACFKAADKDGSGSLDVHELRDMLRANNCKLTDGQIADTFVYLDGPHGDKKISKDEFIKGMEQFSDFLKKLKTLFAQADSDNSGFLDRKEVATLMRSCGQKYSDQDINDIVKAADSSGDGKITFDEFLNAVA